MGTSPILIRIGKRAINKIPWWLGAILTVVDRFPIVMYTGHAFLSPEKLVRCIVSDMKIIGTTVSPSFRELCTYC
jgi:Mn2+/Fe2+ NRAMP family transporter